MALTSIVRQECKHCKKIAIEESRTKLGRTTIIKLACGHILAQTSHVLDDSAYEKIIFSDGAKPRPYQIDAIKFVEESGFRCIIADQQGLGKTIEVLSLLRLHPEILLPAAIVCPSTIKRQFMHEIHRICATDGAQDKKFLTQVIESGKERAVPGFQIYVITYDILKKDDLFKFLPPGYIKTIILDECQRIKNHLSDRAKAVQKIAKDIPYIIPMSGTPIKNNAGEYFTVLNLVKPTLFPHYQKYIDTYCDAYSNGWSQKIGGLKNPQRFHEDTEDIIIRRTKDEVLKDLPPKERKFYHVELDRKLNKAYSDAMDELDEMFYADDVSEFERASNILAIYSKLRHITGISKVEQCVDFATEFLISTERKLVIFYHHLDVMGLLKNQLTAWCNDGGFAPPLVMHSGLNGNERDAIVKRFEKEDSRILLCPMVEGLNLQFCSDAVVLERKWNPPDEEQAEDRFHRFGQKNNVSITYMIAVGTIDDFFTELVEQKRSIFMSVMDKKEISWNQQSLMRELAEILVTKGKKKWSL